MTTIDGRHPGSAAFMPPTLARHMGADGELGNHHFTFSAAALFVDLAGFTPLTEALARSGRDGLDELRTIINHFFGTVVGAVARSGGTVIRFEGDAVVCLFDTTSDASACGSEICRFDGTVVDTLAGRQTLRISAGVGFGDVTSRIVGVGSRRHVIVMGDAISQAVRMQAQAEPGSVNDLSSALGEPASIKAHGAMSIAAEGFLDPTIVERLAAGTPLDEFREVSIVFASLGGAVVSHDVGAAMAVFDRAGGTALTVTGDKGTSILGVVGAPRSIPDQRKRALTAALETSRLLGTSARLGVTTGAVFCGVVGGNERADYTVVGDRVNLAARLMKLAGPGQVLADEATWAGLEKDFRLERARPVTVRGKTEATVIANLVGESDDDVPPLASLRLVNQDTVRTELYEAWSSAVEGGGSMITLRGRAGSGKSRLLGDIAQHVTGAIYSVVFPRYRSNRPYEGFMPALRALAGLDPNRAPELDQLAALIEEVPEWSDGRRGLLARLLGAESVQGDEAAADPRAGRELLQTAAVDLIAARARRAPLAILVDDAESADEASLRLLERLAAEAPRLPILVVAAFRDQGTPRVTTPGRPLEIVDLTRGDALDLALALNGDPALVDAVGTNPLALVLAASSPEVGASDLRTMTQAHIDRLPESERQWFRSASVLGREFPLAVARDSFGPAPVAELEAAGVLQSIIGGTVPMAAFAHDLLQEVAYESLASDVRMDLHNRAGLALESARPSASPEELAYHFGNTADFDRQRHYFEASGKRAAASFEYSAAIDWFRRLKPLTAGNAMYDCALSLGTWHEVLGHSESAIVELTEASADPGLVGIEALTRLVRIRRHQGAMDDADAILGRAERAAAATGDPAAEALTLRVRCEVGGDNFDAAAIEAAAQRLVDLAPLLGDDILAYAHHAIGTARYRSLDGRGAREHLEEALLIADRLGDDLLASQIRNDISGSYYREERLQEGLLYMTAAARDAERIGYRRGAAGMQGNVALFRYRLGDASGALIRELESLAELVRIGEIAFTLQGLMRAGLCYRALGDSDAAIRILDSVIVKAQSFRQPATSVYTLHHRARLDLDAARSTDATGRNDLARQMASDAGFHALDYEIEVLAARAFAGGGDADRAIDTLDNLATTELSSHEAAAILYERWLITDDEDDRTAAANAYRQRHDLAPSAHTARRLGRLTGEKVSLPEVADAGGEPPPPEAFYEFLAELATPPSRS